MSTCISQLGEFGSHDLDDSYTCKDCGVLDEDALRAELQRLRREQDELDAHRRRYRAERDALAATVQRVRDLADRFAEVKTIAPDDALLRKIAKYGVPTVINRHVTTSVLAKVADDLRAALDGGGTR